MTLGRFAGRQRRAASPRRGEICRGDVAFKVITAMAVPDHSTVAEFCRRHEAAIGELFVSVLALCGEAGLVQVGEIAVDGTRMRAAPRGIATVGTSRS